MAITVPDRVARRACYSQHLDAWAIDSRTAAEMQRVLEQEGGLDHMLAMARESPPTEFSPSIQHVMDTLTIEGIPFTLPKPPAATPATGEDLPASVDDAGSEPPSSASDDDDSESGGFGGPAPYVNVGGTAVIPVSGPITKHPSSTQSMFGGSVSVGMRKALALALRDGTVQRIMLHIDSPGGLVAGTGDLADDILRARSVKPTASFIEDIGASAAYWLASQTQHITASRHAEVGSIGVIQVLADRSQQLANAGIKVHVIQSVPGKAKFVDGAPFTDSQKAFFEKRIAEIHESFVASVSAGRGRDFSSLADGRIVNAKEALSQGFVDAVGTFRDALVRFSKPTEQAVTTTASSSASYSINSTPLGAVANLTPPSLRDALAQSTKASESNDERSNTADQLDGHEGHMSDNSGNPAPDAKPVAPTPEGRATPTDAHVAQDVQALRSRLDAMEAERKAEKEAAAKAAAIRLESKKNALMAEFDLEESLVDACNTIEALEALETVARRSATARAPDSPEEPGATDDTSPNVYDEVNARLAGKTVVGPGSATVLARAAATERGAA